MNNFTSQAFPQQIKKLGILAMLFPGVQITSATLLVHNIFPKNPYYGIRMMAVFVLYEVPNWERDGTKEMFVFDQAASNIVSEYEGNSRLLEA